MILKVLMEGISKSVLIKVHTIPSHDRCYINVVFVLQSCTDSLHILPGSSSDTCATSSDCACHICNMKVEKDLDMQGEEGEVNVKTEENIHSEEEDCKGVKDEDGRYSEEEQEGEEGIDVKEEEDVGIKEEVSLEDSV